MARSKAAKEDGPFTNVGAAKALKGRWGEGAKGKEKPKASWHAIDPIIVHSLVSFVGDLGGACSLGVDRSGAGFTVSVFIGGEKVYNQWFSGSEEGVEALHVQVDAFTQDVRALLQDA